MTNRIGNKDVAQQRSKSEKARIKAQNIASEAVKMAEARAKYRNAVRGQPVAGMRCPGFNGESLPRGAGDF